MKLYGFSDSVMSSVDEEAICRRCGSTARIGNGLCVSCLLEPALEGKGSNGDSLATALQEIDVRDADWRLGNYQILEEIGRGGMGVIYRARQRHSRRIVALKRVLSYHADSRATLARFRREAEAAASLDHPNILPIYEVGEADGLPFFSMKLAVGGALLEVKPSLRNNARQIVQLISKVTRAVEYAHAQGIIHRDLKPGNILLDARGEPLVSDFGLAKWLDTSSDLTRTLTIFGTPGYIAPEQANGPAASLKPTADVYSLGAILFDLLAGRPPFLGEHALAVIKQAAEKPAPRLRSFVSSADRDLETICAKCLERDPKNRYQSAAALAEDLERWLENRPITARRILAPARIWRWSRRNPRLVGTAAVCLFLGAATIWMFRGALTRGPQSSIGKQSPTLSPKAAAEISHLQQALIQYPKLQTEIEQSHLAQNTSSMRERLYVRLAAQVGFDEKLLIDRLPKFADTVKRDPDASTYQRASAAYLGEDYPEAERLSLRAAEEAQKTRPARTTDVIQALELASLSAGKSQEFTRAREHLDEAEKLTDRQRDPREWADVQYAIANVLLAADDQLSEAEKSIRSVIEARARIFGPEHRETLQGRRRLALSLTKQGKYTDAEAEYRELLKLDEKILGPEHPETLSSGWDLVVAMGTTSNAEEALVEVRRVLKLRERVLGPEHPDTLSSRNGLTVALTMLGQFSEAIAQLRELVKTEEKVLGPEDNQTLNTLMNLGYALAENGEYTEGETILRQAAKLREKTLGPANHGTLYCRANLAMTLLAENKDIEADTELRDIMKISDKTVGAERSGWTRDLVATVLDKQGKHQAAESQIRQALRLNEKTLGPENSDTLFNRGHLAKNLWYQGKYAEAEAQLRELIALDEKVLGARVYLLDNNVSSRLFEELTPLLSRTLFANTLRDQQKYTEAEAEYKQVIQLEEKALGRDNRDTLNACYNFAYQLGQQGRMSEAKTLAERAAEGAVKVLGAEDRHTREYAKFLEELESGRAIRMPAAQFHEQFILPTVALKEASR